MSKNEEKLIKIGDLAEKLNVTTRTIRYYEEIGLMEAPERIDRGVRVYDEAAVLRLRFILKLKELGLSLKEMHELADIYRENLSHETIYSRLLEILDAHISKVDQKMANLSSLRGDIVSYRQRIVGLINEEAK